MAARLALQGLEWLAVAALTLSALAAWKDFSLPNLGALMLASACAEAARTVAHLATASAQMDEVMRLVRDVAAGRRPGEEGRAP